MMRMISLISLKKMNLVFLDFLSVFWILTLSNGKEEDPFPADFLTPYKEHYRTKRNHRYVRDCQPIHFGNTTFVVANASRGLRPGQRFAQINNLYYEYGRDGTPKNVVGHFVTIEDPLRTFSVLEPKDIGGCSSFTRATAAQSGKQRECFISTNAGFFRTSDGKCYGNVFSDGRKVVDSGGVQNANFGIRKSGTIVVGYLSEEDVLQKEDPFVQLVSGVIWIVRNGTIYVNESKKAECRTTEETGSMDLFASVMSARTAVGHDEQGRVVIVQIDGKTHHRGIDLYNFGKLLQKFGVVNAINLDGGGSATMVVNGTVVNYPSDECGEFNCPRQVSTIVCAHEPDCVPNDCNDHGWCDMGQCHCNTQWGGESCNILLCRENNCSSNGLCSMQDGCICFPGWKGKNCSEACPHGFYGSNCSSVCTCMNGGTCNPKNGICYCTAGWSGDFCEQPCPHGSYGQNCSKSCNCSGSCGCDVQSGKCTKDSSTVLKTTHKWIQCLVDSRVHNLSQTSIQTQTNSEKTKDIERQYSDLFVWFVAVISLCAISVLANFFLVYLACNKATQRRFRIRQEREEKLLFSADDGDDDEL